MALSSMLTANKAVSQADSAALLDKDITQGKLQDLAGTWIKINAASDSLDATMDLMHLGGLVRTAAKLVKGIKITLDEETFSFGIFSVISAFKVTESYPLNGEVSHNRRRDFRGGKSHGSVEATPWGTLRLTYEWDGQYAGHGVDEFLIDAEGRLNVVTTVTVDGRSVDYTLRYHRK